MFNISRIRQKSLLGPVNAQKFSRWPCLVNYLAGLPFGVSTVQHQGDIQSRGGVLPIWWVIHMCRGFDPLFWASGYQTQSFWGVFSHPPTQKRSFGYKSSQNSIFLAPKYHFPLDLFGSNFQWPTAHPQQFSDRVPPPPPGIQSGYPDPDRQMDCAQLTSSALDYKQVKNNFVQPVL